MIFGHGDNQQNGKKQRIGKYIGFELIFQVSMRNIYKGVIINAIIWEICPSVLRARFNPPPPPRSLFRVARNQCF